MNKYLKLTWTDKEMELYLNPSQGPYGENIYILNIVKHLLIARYVETSCWVLK